MAAPRRDREAGLLAAADGAIEVAHRDHHVVQAQQAHSVIFSLLAFTKALQRSYSCARVAFGAGAIGGHHFEAARGELVVHVGRLQRFPESLVSLRTVSGGVADGAKMPIHE